VSDPRDRILPYVRPDERLVWWGQPDPAKHFTGIDAYLIPFSVLWAGFSSFWISAAARSGASLPFVLFGLPFVAMGLYFVFGRFIVKARRKRQTTYALTNLRALVAVGEGSLSESPVHHQPVERKRSRDKRHLTVTFGKSSASFFSGPSYGNTGMEVFDQSRGRPLAFYDVTDVNGLEAAIAGITRG
jgi:hypothetical protein